MVPERAHYGVLPQILDTASVWFRANRLRQRGAIYVKQNFTLHGRKLTEQADNFPGLAESRG